MTNNAILGRRRRLRADPRRQHRELRLRRGGRRRGRLERRHDRLAPHGVGRRPRHADRADPGRAQRPSPSTAAPTAPTAWSGRARTGTTSRASRTGSSSSSPTARSSIHDGTLTLGDAGVGTGTAGDRPDEHAVRLRLHPVDRPRRRGAARSPSRTRGRSTSSIPRGRRATAGPAHHQRRLLRRQRQRPEPRCGSTPTSATMGRPPTSSSSSRGMACGIDRAR